VIWTVGLEDSDFEPTERGVVVKVLVIYGVSAVGSRALALLNSVARGVATSGRLLCSLWMFSSLNDSSLLEMAVAEAGRADIILVALPDWADLSSEVSEWISLLPLSGAKHPRVMVALSDAPTGVTGAAPSAFTRLREATQLRRMDFLPAGGSKVGGAALQTAVARIVGLHKEGASLGNEAGRARSVRRLAGRRTRDCIAGSGRCNSQRPRTPS
jgi:hypothetical protein